MTDHCAMLVMSCDKYASAWHPFFELLKCHWPAHPEQIWLCTETLEYSHEGLTIRCCGSEPGMTWSQRLAKCLQQIDADYIIFSLEDFFLQYDVDHQRIAQCLQYMQAHPDVAVCRLKDSTHPDQILGEEVFPDFYLAGPDVPFRLETQFALWNREHLLSFLDPTEDPWQFEARGTERIKDTPLRFLWYKSGRTDGSLEGLIAPYTVGPDTGFGITWGKWLWKNAAMLKKHGITVDMSSLGTLNPLQIRYQTLVNKAVYRRDPRLHYRCFALGYRAVSKIRRILGSLLPNTQTNR